MLINDIFVMNYISTQMTCQDLLERKVKIGQGGKQSRVIEFQGKRIARAEACFLSTNLASAEEVPDGIRGRGPGALGKAGNKAETGRLGSSLETYGEKGK
jgi:hypothetical protein